MTLSTTDSRFVYDGDASTTAFSFPRKVIEAAHLDVYLYDEDDDSYALQTLNTHYTFAGSGLSDGIYASATITFLSAPGTDKKVVLYRDPALVQEADFTTETNVLAALNRFADRTAMWQQRMQDQINRAIKLPDGDYATSWGNTSTKADYASALLGFNSSGVPMPSAGTSGDVAISTAMTPVVQAATTTLGADALDVLGPLTGEYARSLYERSQDGVSLLDFVPEAERLNVRIGVTAVQTYLQAALDATSGPPANKASIINVPAGNYRFTAQVNVPNGKRIVINMMGDARFYSETNITILSYVRPDSTDFTELTIVNAWFEKVGGVGTSKGIVFQGYDVTKDDSRLVISRGQFRGLARGVQIKHATASISNLYNVDVAIDFYFEHNASFVYLQDITSIRGDRFIYALADAADGISNTLDVQNCRSVEKQLTDCYLYGWDAVNINGGGSDLGGSGTGAGQAALWFDSCSHISVVEHYISSVTGGSVQQNRIGIYATGCYDVAHAGKTVKHCAIGDRYTSSLLINIERVNFDECDLNGVLVDGSASGSIAGCSFDDDPDRTSTNFEIYGNVAGSTNWKVRDNKFAGEEYEFANPGGWDIGDNDWEQDLVP